jgi:hypothetical protein
MPIPASSATRAALGIRSPPAISSIIALTMRLWLDRLRSRRPSIRGVTLAGFAFASPSAFAVVVMSSPLAQLGAVVNARFEASCAAPDIMTHIVPIVSGQPKSRGG